MSRPPALSSRVKTSDDEGVRPLPPAWLGWVIAALAVVLVVAGFVLGILGSGLGHPVDVGAAPVASMALIFPLVGAVIVPTRHDIRWAGCSAGWAWRAR